MRWLLALLLLTGPAWAEPDIQVRMLPDGQLQLHNPPPAGEIDLAVETPRQELPAYTVYGRFWYDAWEDPA
ncbi:MAG: hypothetical protein AB1758_34940, partial [Candidatus Eremiobacterota bacterium]